LRLAETIESLAKATDSMFATGMNEAWGLTKVNLLGEVAI
jgi:hypothetical protein